MFDAKHMTLDQLIAEHERLKAESTTEQQGTDVMQPMTSERHTHLVDVYRGDHVWYREWWAEQARELLDEVERLQAENATLREDAERYRWFREQMLEDAIQCPISVIWGWLGSDDMRCIQSPSELDAAIDAARKGNA